VPEVRLGLPKGSLQDATFDLLRNAGWRFTLSSRSYYPVCNDPEISALLLRPQEMSRYVERGAIDAAITGLDWTEENASDVKVVARLAYAKQSAQSVRWVLAVPEDSPIRSIEDLEGKVISTELVNTVRRYLDSRGVKARVEFSHGATEVKVPHLADAIVDLTETGSSLRANRLRIVETICESVTVIIANRLAWQDKWKRQKIEGLALMLQGALAAADKVLLKMNVSRDNLAAVLEKLPALHSPTVNHLAESGWAAVETIVDEEAARALIPQLRACGAEGIIELPLNKVIP